MQSDNGTEFVNSVLKQLTATTCIDHRLITAYHPRANGAVERSFATIMQMINKFVQGAKKDWVYFVPQTQMWINLHVSAHHGSTPFSLMFCRPFVGLRDHTQTPLGELPKEQLLERLEYAQRVLFPKNAAAATLISRRRKATFDQGRHIKDHPFPDGSFVMLRNQTRKTKMDAQYDGPFKVLRRTRAGTYVLQDMMGDLFPRKAAPSQLKLISVESDAGLLGGEHYTVDTLLNHNGTPGNRTYKVRWAGYSAADDTWEPAENLPVSLINAYWAKLGHNKPGDHEPRDSDTEEAP